MECLNSSLSNTSTHGVCKFVFLPNTRDTGLWFCKFLIWHASYSVNYCKATGSLTTYKCSVHPVYPRQGSAGCRADSQVEYKYVVRNEDGTPTVWKPGSNLHLPLQSGGGSGGLPEALRVSDAWDESWRSIEASQPCGLACTQRRLLHALRYNGWCCAWHVDTQQVRGTVSSHWRSAMTGGNARARGSA